MKPNTVIAYGFQDSGKRLVTAPTFASNTGTTVIPANTQLDHERIASLNLKNCVIVSYYAI